MSNKRRKLTFPISDTMAGPGTYEGEVLMEDLMDTNEIPTVEIAEPYDEFGYGTAKDVTNKNYVQDRNIEKNEEMR